jgi:uncharacterized protein
MKFHLQQAGGHTITGFGPGWIRVDATEFRDSLLLAADAIVPGWRPGGFDALAPGDFARILALSPEIVLLGTGERQRFPRPALYRVLVEAGVGIEVMDTGAACRTYNIIAGEGRRVVAALIVESDSDRTRRT